MDISSYDPDPAAALLADPEYRNAYEDAFLRDLEDRARLIGDDSSSWDEEWDESWDEPCPGGGLPGDEGRGEGERSEGGSRSGDADGRASDPGGLPAVLDGFGDLVRSQRALVAEVDRMVDRVLRAAEADPEPWVGPDPTVDPAWTDPRGRDVATVRRHRSQLAVRAAAADLAVRVRVTENSIRCRGHRARVLSTRCPLTWRAYLSGDVSEQNAATAAALADSLPAAPEIWALFDERIAPVAATLAPGRFRTRARAVRERVHSTSLAQRRERAMGERGVWVTPDLDGMATLTAVLPAERAYAVDDLLEGHARHLAAQPGETRTLAHLRADVFSDLLAPLHTPGNAVTVRDGATVGGGASVGDGGDTARFDDETNSTPTDSGEPTNGRIPCPTCGDTVSKGPAPGIRPTVYLTIPALSLLGRSDEPAMLEGYGPIPLDTARELAGTATSLVRVLTHPVTGTVLDLDRRSYRVPAALRRWLRLTHPTCVFPGCQKPSHRCDIDHRKRWADGGTTSARNNEPLCEPHHPVKDETLWGLHRDPDTGHLVWISPTGHTTPEDPPPF